MLYRGDNIEAARGRKSLWASSAEHMATSGGSSWRHTDSETGRPDLLQHGGTLKEGKAALISANGLFCNFTPQSRKSTIALSSEVDCLRLQPRPCRGMGPGLSDCLCRYRIT